MEEQRSNMKDDLMLKGNPLCIEPPSFYKVSVNVAGAAERHVSTKGILAKAIVNSWETGCTWISKRFYELVSITKSVGLEPCRTGSLSMVTWYEGNSLTDWRVERFDSSPSYYEKINIRHVLCWREQCRYSYQAIR